MADDKILSASESEAILKEARKRLKMSIDAEADNRKAALDDLEFVSGEQWPEAARKARGDRPCLTINRMPSFVRQVVNEQRKTRPAIDVIPADSKAAKPTADVIQGLVRHIERTSRSQIAYDTAFEYAVSCGFGHFRVTTKYCDDEVMDQDITIERIENPFTVYRDPLSKEPDHSDDRYTFVTEMVDAETFEDKYGFAPSKFADVSTGDNAPDWYDDDNCRVAEYWRVTIEESEINVLRSGERITGKLTKDQIKQLSILDPVVKTRKVERKKVEQYILTYDRVIRVSEWAGRYIPICTVVGGEVNINGRRKLTSLVRDAKEPARIYNYWTSAETEVVALQPKAPWIAPAGSFEGHEHEWARANTENLAYLEFEPQPSGGPPQRQFFPGVPQGIREGRMAAAEDIKAVTGLYDASLGARSNETSGVAIRERQREGDTATYHYIDNMSRAIEQCGRVIIDLIPHIYDTPRAVRILGPDNEEQVVAINQLFIDPKTGQEYMHDLQLGKYDVAVKVGPSFESRRQEMTEAMIELASRNPQIMQIAGDLVLKNMDWPESEKIAERMAKMLPPQLQETPDGKPVQSPPPPEVLAAQEEAKGVIQVEQIKAEAVKQRSLIDAKMKKYEIDTKAQTEIQSQYLENSANLLIKSQQANIEEQRLHLDQQKVLLDQQLAQYESIAQRVNQIDVTPIMATLQQVMSSINEPREGEIVRGADGRAVGVRSKRRALQ